jgi:AcrR family transcriptional regulator
MGRPAKRSTSGAKTKPVAKSMGGVAKKSDATRERIVASAAKMFAERGYAHTRLTDIAKAAKFHAGGIYYYFESREALVEEVLLRATKRAQQAVIDALDKLPKGATTEDRIKAGTIAQIREIYSRNFYTAAFNKIYPQIPDSVRNRHRASLHEFFDVWRRVLQQGQAAGEVRKDVDLAIIRLTVAGAIQWSTEWADPNESPPEMLGEQMAKLLYAAVAPPRSR